MAKYDPLGDWLRAASDRAELFLSFSDVEQLIGEPLPASAHRHPAWWANEQGGRHVQARAWLDAGWSVDAVDQQARRVRFRRSPLTTASAVAATGLPRPRAAPEVVS